MAVEFDRLDWHRSSYPCGSGACLETARTAETVHVRDSTRPDGDVLSVPSSAWRAFVAGLRDGAFDR